MNFIKHIFIETNGFENHPPPPPRKKKIYHNITAYYEFVHAVDFAIFIGRFFFGGGRGEEKERKKRKMKTWD